MSARIPLVLLACGSFNPITNQHMRLFELARDHLHQTGQFQVVGGIVSPVSDGYVKQGLVLAKHRIAMARLALQSSDWVSVDDWESQQPDWTETVVTMRYHYGRILKQYQEGTGKDSGPTTNSHHITNVNVAIRKIATLLKPDKDISVDGDHMVIKTLSTFKNYNMDFHVDKEFEEDLSGVDDRKCMTTISWEGDKLVCVQKGEKEGRGWTHWVEGDRLYLELRACGAVCKQVFEKT
ncbi:nicotinamide/nicotinic acid mononucleotide adenylyltransferase 3-like isoform X2 [Salvelinus alpinus]|uniref:nicotinamide/nicotinic acid mononucleotide adenylyltransferase 3-like isoform X2 n=1 Tax=Salvelinus alpinus TaxID=8036 RepID=UPI0039FD14F1